MASAELASCSISRMDSLNFSRISLRRAISSFTRNGASPSELVDEDKPRLAEQRLSDRQHLALAAAEVAGRLLTPLRQNREYREKPLQIGGRLGDSGIVLVPERRKIFETLTVEENLRITARFGALEWLEPSGILRGRA